MSQTDTLTLNPKIHNPCNTLRIGLSDYIRNIAFRSKFVEFLGYPEYILIRCGVYFSTAYSSTSFLKQCSMQRKPIQIGTVPKPMINAVESDNDCDDDNTKTNPRNVKHPFQKIQFSLFIN